MSDYNSSLPIRTEAAGDAIVKICDATVTSQQLKVESDGSINTNTTISATDLDIRDLVFATDKVDVSGSEVSLDATTLAALENITVSATDLDIRDLAFATDTVDVSGSSVTVTATNLDVRDLVFATDKVDVSGSEVSLDATTLAALENITVSATDLDIRNLSHTQVDSVKIGDGTEFLEINPDGSINVKILDGTAGTDVTVYSTATVAAAATSNHDYTSTGNFYLTQIVSSGSGKMKIEVLVNAVTKLVQFNSTATPNMNVTLNQPILATTGQVVRVIRTNKDNQSQDVYSTICGYTI